MLLKQFIAPIAAATIVNAVLFAAMWRGHQIERKSGKATWQYEAGLIGYILAIGVIAYFCAERLSSGPLDLFAIALVGEGIGVVNVFVLIHAFFRTRGEPWRERAFPIFGALVLTGIVFGALLGS